MINVAAVWQKRYWDNKVLISTNKVFPRKCYVFFCADKSYQNLYSYNGAEVIDKCEVQKNGKGTAYIVPMSYLVDEGPLPEQFKAERDSEYAKYKAFSEKQNNLKSKK